MLAPSVIGILLALAVSIFAVTIRLDRDRAFYPTVLMVVASYYILFSVIDGTRTTMAVECAVAAVFLAAATLGFKRSLWLAAAGFAAHGMFDLFHDILVTNPGMPAWWPAFCASYDVTAAAFLAWTLRRRRRTTAPGAAATHRG